MKARQLFLYTSILVLVTACGNNINTNAPDLLDTQVDNQIQSSAEASIEDFVAGVFIQFDQYQEEVKEDHILDNLKSNLETFIDHDEKQYRSIFDSEQTADENMFLFDMTYQYAFNEIEYVNKPYPDTIHISIVGFRLERSSKVQEVVRMLYAFRQLESGEW
jgi:hypothetical protein